MKKHQPTVQLLETERFAEATFWKPNVFTVVRRIIIIIQCFDKITIYKSFNIC